MTAPGLSSFGDGTRIQTHRRGQLDFLRLDGETATIEIFAQGAHLTSWVPRGQRPVLFLSKNTLFAPGRAIRGGVPLVFPWFGARTDDPQAPAHGYARTVDWTTRLARIDEQGRCVVEMALVDDDASRASWPHAFEVIFRVEAGESLELTLSIRNRGPQPMPFEAAFHTYFSVSEIRRVEVHGLENTAYLDKPTGMARRQQLSEPIRFIGEVDRLYVNTESVCSVVDPDWQRRIVITKSGSLATVVWNPWEKVGAGMSDLGADQWPHMLCVESAIAAENKVVLAPGEVHSLGTRVEIVRE